MSQNDFTIANQGFPAFRADLNTALQALATNNSGATAPSTTFANMWWYDSATDIMYIRNEDNDAWIKFAELDQTNDKFVLSGTLQLDDGTVSAPALTFNSDTNMGLYRGGTDILKFVTAGADRVTILANGYVGIGTTTPNESLSVADSIVSGDLGDSTTTVYRLEPANTNFTRQLTISDRVGATAGATKGNAIIFSSKYTGDVQQGMAGIVGISESISGNQKGALAFLTRAHDENPTERMRIDSSGSLLAGTTADPITGGFSRPIVSFKQLNDSSFTSGIQLEANGNTNVLAIGYNGDTFQIGTSYRTTGGYVPISFSTGGAERMIIDSSGNVLVGITDIDPAGNNTTGVSVSPSTGISVQGTTSALVIGVSSAQDYAVAFRYQGILAGRIGVASSDITVADVSDYRLKENIAPLADALTKIKALNPSSYNFINYPDKTYEGFIAHELQEVIPNAVSGEKDALITEATKDRGTVGEIDPQCVDLRKLIPILVGAIQEQQALIEALTDRITALEGA